MRDPRLEPEPGELVVLLDKNHSQSELRQVPYDPALHREGLWKGDIARWIDKITDEQWRIFQEGAEPEVS